MSNTVISVEHLPKQYNLGIIGTGTLSRDLERWWARVRGKANPLPDQEGPFACHRAGLPLPAPTDRSLIQADMATFG